MKKLALIAILAMVMVGCSSKTVQVEEVYVPEPVNVERG